MIHKTLCKAGPRLNWFLSTKNVSTCWAPTRLSTSSTNSSVQKSDIFHEHVDSKTLSLYEGICRGDRACLARGITLVESTNKMRSDQARLLVNQSTWFCKQKAKELGKPFVSFRIGLSGPPGAGKSTFIEVLGKMLTNSGHRVAVLAVDPSSGTTGGSLLGDTVLG